MTEILIVIVALDEYGSFANQQRQNVTMQQLQVAPNYVTLQLQ